MTEDEIKEAELREANERKEKEDKGEKVEEPSEAVPRVKKETFTDRTFEQVNSSKPLWLQEPKEISDSDYVEFYKTLTNNSDSPPAYTHFNAEGDINFKAIM